MSDSDIKMELLNDLLLPVLTPFITQYLKCTECDNCSYSDSEYCVLHRLEHNLTTYCSECTSSAHFVHNNKPLCKWHARDKRVRAVAHQCSHDKCYKQASYTDYFGTHYCSEHNTLLQENIFDTRDLKTSTFAKCVNCQVYIEDEHKCKCSSRCRKCASLNVWLSDAGVVCNICFTRSDEHECSFSNDFLCSVDSCVNDYCYIELHADDLYCYNHGQYQYSHLSLGQVGFCSETGCYAASPGGCCGVHEDVGEMES